MNSESNRVKLVTILLNISQVACGGNVVGNKFRCISWQQGFSLGIYRCLVKVEAYKCLGKPALANPTLPPLASSGSLRVCFEVYQNPKVKSSTANQKNFVTKILSRWTCLWLLGYFVLYTENEESVF